MCVELQALRNSRQDAHRGVPPAFETLRTLRAQHPEWTLIACDVTSAFQELDRHTAEKTLRARCP
eukprot:5130955-Prorocentrum_lima.AAC.1